MGTIFGLLLLALLCVMSIVEIARYYRQRESAELPYPRRRLSRRLGIGIIFGIVILLVTFWPKMTPLMDLTFIGLLFVLFLMGSLLLLRDLRETGREVLEQTNNLNQQAGETFTKLVDEARKKNKKE